MEVHANAPLSPIGRRRVVDRVLEQEWSITTAALAAGVSERTVYRWLARWRAHGPAGLVDRRSVPHRIPHKTPADRVVVICELRRLRLTAAEISTRLQMPLSTVSAVLKREGLGKRSRLAPVEPPNRYERSTPGELIHIDIKKLGRFARAGKRATGGGIGKSTPSGMGWEAVHVAVDDFSRLAYVEVLADQKASTAIGFLSRAIAFYASHNIRVQRVMTDNGSAYVSDAHRIACAQLGVRHLRIQPYRPRTNGKAERFIQTLLREWAYRRAYRSSAERNTTLHAWLLYYNFTRPHGSLSHKPPGTRLTKAPRNYS
jgi:transposase InsO family protein